MKKLTIITLLVFLVGMQVEAQTPEPPEAEVLVGSKISWKNNAGPTVGGFYLYHGPVGDSTAELIQGPHDLGKTLDPERGEGYYQYDLLAQGSPLTEGNEYCLEVSAYNLVDTSTSEPQVYESLGRTNRVCVYLGKRPAAPTDVRVKE